MSTLTMPVEEERFNIAVVRGRAPKRDHEEHSTAKLSTFNMPHTVEVTVMSNDVCKFDFIYPVDERPEPRHHAIESRPVDVILGHSSRKILAVWLRNATLQLTKGAPHLPLKRAAEGWAKALPEHAQFACVRNAEVVETILLSMPQHVRMELVNAIHEEAEKAEHGPQGEER